MPVLICTTFEACLLDLVLIIAKLVTHPFCITLFALAAFLRLVETVLEWWPRPQQPAPQQPFPPPPPPDPDCETEIAVIRVAFPDYLGKWHEPPPLPVDAFLSPVPGLTKDIQLNRTILCGVAIGRRLVNHFPEQSVDEISLCRWSGFDDLASKHGGDRVRVRPLHRQCGLSTRVGIMYPPTSITVDAKLRVVCIEQSSEDANMIGD